MEKQTKKLSLDAFKDMAEKVQTEEVMQKVEGGDFSECHGTTGQIAKVIIAIGKEVFL
ncbi:hypothetical protein [Chryseobacterium fistulae]|uniref:Uncharacterized protein n=1 Tax=Chryseobacterium fistulae TaxID=2675058 RepID=A0A6N4XZC9_9FLAO|nr:hypothetical protein [Chryseobacterium fistulae]CAA7393231.1 hypothetical protein CHRY9393_03480 [Chryseobacterium fistulae]